MNNTAKMIVIAVGGLGALCLCLTFASWLAFRGTGQVLLSQAIEDDPAEIAIISEDIADYTLPTDFGEGQAAQLANFSMVSFTAVDGRTHITLLQAPASLPIDQDELERQMSLASGRDEWSEVTVIETKPCQIRGERATLVISEGVSHDGHLYRSASAVFAGNGGMALVNVSGPAANWDQAMVDSFIESLQ